MRELLGEMSPAEFARRMEVTESTVSRWLSEERHMSYLHTVMGAKILNCHAEDFYEVSFVSRRKRK